MGAVGGAHPRGHVFDPAGGNERPDGHAQDSDACLHDGHDGQVLSLRGLDRRSQCPRPPAAVLPLLFVLGADGPLDQEQGQGTGGEGGVEGGRKGEEERQGGMEGSRRERRSVSLFLFSSLHQTREVSGLLQTFVLYLTSSHLSLPPLPLLPTTGPVPADGEGGRVPGTRGHPGE